MKKFVVLLFLLINFPLHLYASSLGQPDFEQLRLCWDTLVDVSTKYEDELTETDIENLTLHEVSTTLVKRDDAYIESAAKFGKAEAIQSYLDQGLYSDKEAEIQNALKISVKNSFVNAIKVLIKNGGLVDFEMLEIAALRADYNTYKEVFKNFTQDEDFTSQILDLDNNQENLLHKTSMSGNFKKISHLVNYMQRKGYSLSELMDIHNDEGLKPIHLFLLNCQNISDKKQMIVSKIWEGLKSNARSKERILYAFYEDNLDELMNLGRSSFFSRWNKNLSEMFDQLDKTLIGNMSAEDLAYKFKCHNIQRYLGLKEGKTSANSKKDAQLPVLDLARMSNAVYGLRSVDGYEKVNFMQKDGFQVATYVSRHPMLKSVVISFRGSSNFKDLKRDIALGLGEETTLKMILATLSCIEGGAAFAGMVKISTLTSQAKNYVQRFSESDVPEKLRDDFYKVIPVLLSYVRSEIEKYQDDYRVFFTGHSLGGLYAQVCSVVFDKAGAAFNSPGIPEFVMDQIFRGEDATPTLGRNKSFICHNINGDLVSVYLQDRRPSVFVQHGAKIGDPLEAHSMSTFIEHLEKHNHFCGESGCVSNY